MADKNKRSRRASGAAVAEPETDSQDIASEDVADAGSVIESDQEATPGRRLPHVDAKQFAALRDELKLSNKQVAEAIGRTLARVSELTYSQGASIQTWERYEKEVREYAANLPAKGEATTEEESADSDEE